MTIYQKKMVKITPEKVHIKLRKLTSKCTNCITCLVDTRRAKPHYLIELNQQLHYFRIQNVIQNSFRIGNKTHKIKVKGHYHQNTLRYDLVLIINHFYTRKHISRKRWSSTRLKWKKSCFTFSALDIGKLGHLVNEKKKELEQEWIKYTAVHLLHTHIRQEWKMKIKRCSQCTIHTHTLVNWMIAARTSCGGSFQFHRYEYFK